MKWTPLLSMTVIDVPDNPHRLIRHYSVGFYTLPFLLNRFCKSRRLFVLPTLKKIHDSVIRLKQDLLVIKKNTIVVKRIKLNSPEVTLVLVSTSDTFIECFLPQNLAFKECRKNNFGVILII
jgi:hypothetical protein